MAAVLTVSMLMTSVTPLMGLAKTYYEVPIGNSEMGDYDLATMPNATVKVDFGESSRDLTADDLENEDGYGIKFGVVVKFDWSEIATPDKASASDWNPDEVAGTILSEIDFVAEISEESKDIADKLGLEAVVENTDYYALILNASKLDTLAPGTYSVNVKIHADKERVSSYPPERIEVIDDDAVTLNITVPKESLEKLVVDPATAARLCRSGKIKAFKAGREWRITQLALQDYVLSESKLTPPS